MQKYSKLKAATAGIHPHGYVLLMRREQVCSEVGVIDDLQYAHTLMEVQRRFPPILPGEWVRVRLEWLPLHAGDADR
jgi:hypothetical protein